jgi:RNA polymerase sigma factor (sigma-70 family)
MPNRSDTSLGGTQGRFPDTTGGLLSRVTSDAPRAAIELLCSRYWKPVYRYVRIAWAKTNEDAKDLTQAFLLWLLEGGALRKYEPVRGGFRPYLKTLLQRFLVNQEESLHRLKRGGGIRILDLSAVDEFVPDGANPEEAFDRAWLKTVLEHAIDRVRKRYETSNRATPFRVFEAYDLEPDGTSTYADLAARFNVKESDVRNWLFAIREELRGEIRAELSRTTADERELEEEWNALFGA